MAAGDHGAETLAAYARAQARLEHAGGYAWREHANAAVRGLGFADDDLDRNLTTFSGGELTRASLARALWPAIPTSSSSTSRRTTSTWRASSGWRRSLPSLDAAVVLVAHDRWFLEAVTNATLELEAGRSTYFRGPWHVWRREKAERACTPRRRRPGSPRTSNGSSASSPASGTRSRRPSRRRRS